MTLFQLGRLNELNRAMSFDRRNLKNVAEYLNNFWFDLDVHSIELRRAIVSIAGIEQVVHGTNFSAGHDFGDPAAGLGLTNECGEKIRSGNAIKLLGL